jgi:hypothetical protein
MKTGSNMAIREWVRPFIKDQLKDFFTPEYPPEIIDDMNDEEVCSAVGEFFYYSDLSGSGLEGEHKTLIGEVLARLPKDIFMELNDLSVIFIVPTLFGASTIKLNTFETESVNMVLLPVMSPSRSKDVILGEIVHELAHICAEHHEIESRIDEIENEADAIAIAWGFETEIEVMNREIQAIKAKSENK